MTNELTIQELLEKEKIREVIGIRYARGLDWYDLDMLKSCFHVDAELDYRYFKGNAHQWCEKRVVEGNPAELHRFHYCFPAQVEIQGDVAHTESNSYAGYRTRDDAGENASTSGRVTSIRSSVGTVSGGYRCVWCRSISHRPWRAPARPAACRKGSRS